MGKTKLALMLYAGLTATHQLSALTPFTSHALISLDMEDGPNELRQHLRGALSSLGAKNVDSGEISILKGRLQQLVQRQKVLLVVDNVGDGYQLDSILPTRFAEGSLVIITSRLRGLPASEAFVEVSRV
jgi:hypothetical protein